MTIDNFIRQVISETRVRNVCVAIAALPLVCITNSGAAAVTIDYAYDDLNRLVAITRDDTEQGLRYKYDAVSNIEWIANADSPDTDGDLTPNFADGDDDDDGIPDTVEIDAGLNPLSATDAAGDRDGDGVDNLAEFTQGSDINHFHGDLDSDGQLGLGDIVILQRIIFDLQYATQEQGESGHGDVNMDGNLDVGDLVILRRAYFGY